MSSSYNARSPSTSPRAIAAKLLPRPSTFSCDIARSIDDPWCPAESDALTGERPFENRFLQALRGPRQSPASATARPASANYSAGPVGDPP